MSLFVQMLLPCLLVQSPGELPGIVPFEDYTVSLYCDGLPGVDGLAISPSGELFAASETEGSVYRIGEDGRPEMVLNGLSHPEGITFDGSGTLYVVEDVLDGRLLAWPPSSPLEVLASGLEYPEGVVISRDGGIFVTESSLEGGGLPPWLTTVSQVAADTLRTVYSSLFLWSCSGMAFGNDGMLYVCNETSGIPFIDTSVLRIDPASGEWEVFCRGLLRCEGLSFSADGGFPLLVAEEDVGDGSGRLSAVDSTGAVSVFAEGFLNIEDVAVDSEGRIFVSEDTSGRVLVLAPQAD